MAGCANAMARPPTSSASSASDPAGPRPVPAAPSGPLFVDVGAPDDVRVDGVVTPQSELRDKVAAARGDRVLAIRANADVPWWRAVGIMDTLLRVTGPQWRLVVATDASRSADVPLPLVGTKESKVVVVTVDRDGATSVDGRSGQDLAAEIRLRAGNGGRVAIRADKDAPFGAVVDVTKIVQAAGGIVAFAVSPVFEKARVRAAAWEACPFPPESDKAGIDDSSVTVDVRVDAEGRPIDARVVTDPGHGFGEAARRCALRASFDPARDHDGRGIEAQTGPFRVRFHREPPDAAPTPTADPSGRPGTPPRKK